ncbi:MAG: hypothetical protein QF732_11260 [Nitrospinaceae bacterium]|jgi:hypothetical protein|nr:hypothetical protein [Nitrospinaceae bacterium]|tara:strand:- start:361 stop:726 length:366 start_codon:yes stop_codon:yes gene_type:complete
MADHKSTAGQIADEVGCSTATVNNKVKGLGFKFKGRSPNNHGKLMDALATVKPRRKAKKTAALKKVKKAAASGTVDLDSFFNEGKAHIVEIRRRLSALEKEKAALEDQLAKLYSLHPKMKK